MCGEDIMQKISQFDERDYTIYVRKMNNKYCLMIQDDSGYGDMLTPINDLVLHNILRNTMPYSYDLHEYIKERTAILLDRKFCRYPYSEDFKFNTKEEALDFIEQIHAIVVEKILCNTLK